MNKCGICPFDKITTPDYLCLLCKFNYHVDRDNYFDVAEGLYWFCAHYNNGQWSPLYRIQCQLQYKPAWFEKDLCYIGNDATVIATIDQDYHIDYDPEDRLIAQDFYNFLCEYEAHYGYQNVEIFCERILERIQEISKEN